MNQKDVWNGIAPGWSDFRQKPVREIEEFSRGKKGNILDVGCGNCRHLVLFKGELHGIDFSSEMIKQAEEYCKKKGIKTELKEAEANKIPYPDNTFDVVVFTAVLHNLKEDEREETLKDIKRVMKDGAEIIISVWNKEEKGMKFIPWKKCNGELMRYHYFFEKDELKELIEKYFVVEKIWISRNKESNIFVIAKKR